MLTAPDHFAQAVRDAADRPDVRAAVTDLYARVQASIDARRPRCDLSGRCCRFEEFGHRLFVTTIELATFVNDLGAASGHGSLCAPDAWDGVGCPFQVGKLCGVHTFRPFGCRMFFCDPSSTAWQNDAYEQFHAELKRLHASFDVPYAYVEWRAALRAMGLTRAEPAAP